jgi:hypothetical protein
MSNAVFGQCPSAITGQLLVVNLESRRRFMRLAAYWRSRRLERLQQIDWFEAALPSSFIRFHLPR